MAINTDVLADFRESKKKLEALEAAARKQMQGRYLALLTEAADILVEYKASFGKPPELPGTVKAFTLGVRQKPAPSETASKGKKIGGLRRSLNAAIKRGDTAKIAEVENQLLTFGAPPVVPLQAPPMPEAVSDSPGQQADDVCF